MASCHIPVPISSQLLSKLLRIAENDFAESHRVARECIHRRVWFMDCEIEKLSCPHLYYPSTQSFVDHLLQFLNYCTWQDESKQHVVVLSAFLQFHFLCGNCMNAILSTVPFKDLFLGHGLAFGVHDESWNWESLHLPLYRQLLRHPRFPEIMVTCSVSMDYFQSFCNFFVETLNIGGKYQSFDVFHYFLLEIARLFFLTLKYWNMKHVLYYKTNYFDYFGAFLDSMKDIVYYPECLSNPMEHFGSMLMYIETMIWSIQCTVIKRCGAVPPPDPRHSRVKNWYCSTHNKSSFRSVTKLLFRGSQSCSFSQCGKMLDPNDEENVDTNFNVNYCAIGIICDTEIDFLCIISRLISFPPAKTSFSVFWTITSS